MFQTECEFTGMAQAQEKEVKDTDTFFLAYSIFNSLASQVELCIIDLRLYKLSSKQQEFTVVKVNFVFRRFSWLTIKPRDHF